MPRSLKRGMIGWIRYAGSGEARSVLEEVRGEGWAWRRRWVRGVQRWGEICGWGVRRVGFGDGVGFMVVLKGS